MRSNVEVDLAMRDAEPAPVELTYGVVTQASPLEATVGSATTAVALKKLASYTPTLGDFIAVLVRGGDRLALGTID